MKHNFSDKEYLEEIVKNSLSKAEILRKLNIVPAGGNYRTLSKYISEYNIDISHFTGKAWNQGEKIRSFCIKYPTEYYLVDNKYCSTSGLKKRLIDDGYKKHVCENCKLNTWNGLPIPIELDHINGKSNDNRLDNLRILCPNCHAQTETYRGKNQNRKCKTNSIEKYTIKTPQETKILKEKIYNECQECGIKTTNISFCSNQCRYNFNSKNIPSKEKLIDRIKIIGKNFSALGRDFGVSDNAVRKWFLKYDLI